MKKKKILIVIAAITVVAAVGVSIFGVKLYQNSKSDTDVKTGMDEELVYGKITAVNGNELQLIVLEEQTSGSEKTSPEGMTGEEATGDESTDKRTPPEGMTGEAPTDMGEAPTGEAPTDMGEAPEGMTGEAPSGKGNPPEGMTGEAPTDMGNPPEGMTGEAPGQQNGKQGGSNKDQSNITTYTETDQTLSVEVPVGTDVITKLGATTTFSYLNVDDKIALSIKKDTNVITKIWIIE